MAFQVAGSTGSKSVSPIKRQKALDQQRMEVLKVLNRHIDKGSSVPTYDADWQDYLIMGAIDVPAYINWRGGAKLVGYEQAHFSGVRVRAGTIKKLGELINVLSLNRFGDKGWQAFSQLSASDQDQQLTNWGLIGGNINSPTTNPTNAPTTNPTNAPTTEPTNAPATSPTVGNKTSEAIAQAKTGKSGKVIK